MIGAGVAGLQAIATAKRLGARVEAFDTRPVVAEQVQSLGAKFVEIDLGEVGQTEQGYAKELTPEQVELQREGQKKVIAQSDVVITTAQVFGRPAPRIVGRDMVEAMKPGSVVIDMAVETGGNVEGSELDKVVDINGVKVVGQGNLPSEVARNASEMYSNNLFNLLDEFWDEEAKTLTLDPEDEIVQNCVITRDGSVVNATIKNIYSEYRLILREDNADLRLTPIGRELGLVDDARWSVFEAKHEAVEAEKRGLALMLRPHRLTENDELLIGKALQRECTAAELLRRPELDYTAVSGLSTVGAFDAASLASDEQREQVELQLEVQAKYAGYIERQEREIAKHAKQESLRLPENIDYSLVDGLSNEARQKLAASRPVTLGQASRLEGMTPSAVSLLLIHLKKRQLRKSA